MKNQSNRSKAELKDIHSRSGQVLRQQVAAELSMKNIMLESIFESAPYIMMLVNEDGRVVDINRIGVRFTGRNKDELLGFFDCEVLGCLNSFHGPECADHDVCNVCPVRSQVTQTLETGKPIYESEACLEVIKDGIDHRLDFLISTSLVQTADERQVLVTLADITERKQAEDALRLRESYLSAIIENLPGLVWLKDPNGKFLAVNTGFSKSCGFDRPEALVGKTDLDIWPQELAARYKADDARVIQSAKPVTVEEPVFVNSENKWFETFKAPIIDEQGLVIGTTGYARDITERKGAEDNLRQLNERLNLATRAANLGIWDWDVPKNILTWNDKMYEFYGVNKADFTGVYDAWLSGIHPEDVARCNTAIERALLGEKEYNIEFRIIRPDGATRHLKAYAQIVRAIDGTPLRMTGINYDITESKQAEAERELTVQMLQLLNAKTELKELMRDVMSLLQNWSGCEAIGIRLRDGDDYPYFETNGFPTTFIEREKSLCAHDLAGQIIRDQVGNPLLECMCGNILCGRFNPDKPFFTAHGSFWSNSTSELLALTTESDRQARTRNRCNGEGYESVALIPLRAGQQVFGLLQFNDHRRDRFTPASIALFERLADSLAIALSQRQIEKALQESEYFFKESQRAAFTGSYKTDFITGLWESSEVLDQIFGIDQNYVRDVPGWLGIVHPDDRETMSRYLTEKVIGQHQRFDHEYRIIRRSDGQVRWVHGLGEVNFDSEGRILSLIGTIQDITERWQAEDALRASLVEKEILLKEVHHRVKNNLASINGLIDLQQATLTDPVVINEFNELSGRIRSMALVHELLYQSEAISRIDLNDYFETLVARLRSSYDPSARVRFSVAAAGVEMNLDDAIPCGLIVNELVTNSFKYAFPEGNPRAGQQKCEIKVTVNWDGSAYRLTVCDNGIGLPVDFNWQTAQSLGLQLVMLLGQRQLKGQIDVDRTAGTTVCLSFAPKHKNGG